MRSTEKRTFKSVIAFLLVVMVLFTMAPSEIWTADAAASFIHVYQRGAAVNYLGTMFPVRVYDNSNSVFAAYSLSSSNMSHYDEMDFTMHHSEKDNFGYSYILSHGLISDKLWMGDEALSEKSFEVKYYATQAAISAYNGQISTDWSSDPEGIGSYVSGLVRGAQNAESEDDIIELPSCSVSINQASSGKHAKDHDLYEADGYFRTQTLKLSGDGDFSVALSATSKNKITNVANKMERVGDVNGDFYYRIKIEDVTDVLNVKITATASLSVPYYFGNYYLNGEGMQPLLIPEEDEQTVSESDSIIVNCDKMKIVIEKQSEVVDDVTGASSYKPAYGIRFKIVGPETYFGETDDEGRLVFNDIPYGSYTVTEMNIPSYYYTPQIERINGVPGKTYTLNVTNVLKRGIIQVQKRIEPATYAAYESLAGFTFRLTGISDSGHRYNLTAVTKTDGIARFTDETGKPDLLVGTYTITEILDTNQQRFYPKTESQTVTVKENQTVTREFVNIIKTGAVNIQKISEDGFVENMGFYLYGESLAYRETGYDIYKYTKPDPTARTDAGGLARFTDILIGDYSIEEVYPDDGRKQYKYIKPDIQTITVNWNGITNTTVNNILKRGNVTVQLWAEDGQLANHRLRLTGMSFAKIPVDEVAYTDASGIAHFNNILISGDPGDDNYYTLTEENVPERYYTQAYNVDSLSDNVTLIKNETINPIKVQVTYNDAQRRGDETYAKFFDLLKRGNIRVVLRAEDTLVYGRKFRLTFTSLAYEQTGVTTITAGTIKDTGMDSASMNRNGDLQLRNGTEYLKGTYEMTTKNSPQSNGFMEVDGVTWNTAEIVFKDIPISGSASYVIEEIDTPTRYIHPYSQEISVKSNEVTEVKFLNELKRGSFEVHKTSEDGFIEGMIFKLSGTSFAYRQINGQVTQTVYGELLNDFEYTATTNKDGVAVFENLLITDDDLSTANTNAQKYKVEEIQTKTRYIQPAAQYTDVVWNEARLYKEGGPGPGSIERWKNATELHYYNQLKRGDLIVKISTEDGFLSGFLFHLTGTCLAERQTGANGETQTGKLIRPDGTENTVTDHEDLYKIDFTAVTDSTGTAKFENILISHDEPTSDSTWYYSITPVNTPRRYEIPADQKAPVYWKSSSSYTPETRSFYDKLKRGRLIIQKYAEKVDPATRWPIDNELRSGYRFTIHVKSLASIESGVNTPPAYYGQYGKDRNGNLTSSAVAGSAYETMYTTLTDSEGRAVFNDILINDYLYSDIGNYRDYTHDLIDLPDGSDKKYYYEIEEVNLSNDFMQPDKQYVNVKWYNDIGNSNKPDAVFENKLKTFRVVMERQDIETGYIPQGDALLVGATYGFYYNGNWLKDYRSEYGETLIEKDPTLAGVLEEGHAYIVTDYYVCGDGYALQEVRNDGNIQQNDKDQNLINGYYYNDTIVYVSANSSRFIASDRYDRTQEKVEYTISGDPNSSAKYMTRNRVLKKTITLVKTVRPEDEFEGQPEYAVEFKVYLLSKGFTWDEASQTPDLTNAEPYLRYVNPSITNPHDYNMQDVNVVNNIEQWQTEVRNRVTNAARFPQYPDQDYLITNVNGMRKTIELPYGHYVVEQVTSWNSYEAMKATYIQLTEDDQGNANNVYLYIKNIIDKQYVRVVKIDSEIDKIKHPDEADRTVAIAGATFKLWDTVKKEYVPVKYSNHPTYAPVYEFKTNDLGIAQTDDRIEAGIYEIHEIDSVTGFARAKWELRDLETIAIGYDARCFDDNGLLLDYVTVYFTNNPQKTVLKIFNQGERLHSVSQTSAGGQTTYAPNYKTVGLEGAVFDIYAVESPTSFNDIPTSMVQYAKPINASNSSNLSMCYPRYYDPFGNQLITTIEPVATVTTDSTGWAQTQELYNGLYRIVQTKAPDGMLLETTPRYVYINNVDQENRVVDYPITITNYRQKVHFTVDKAMEQIPEYNIGYSGEVTSVTFGLYARRDITALNGTKIPANGLVSTVTMRNTNIAKALGSGTFNVDLVAGEYYVKEMRTHVAYNIDNNKYYVTFDYYPNAALGDTYVVDEVEYTVDSDGYIEIKPTNPRVPTRDTTLTNTAKRGIIKGHKVEQGNTNVRVNGALFALFFPDTTDFTLENAIVSCFSANGGYFEFPDIPYGRWILKELEPPEGYLLTNMSTQTANMENDGQIIDYNIENELIRGIIYLKKYDKVSAKTIVDHTSSRAQFTLFQDLNGDGQLDTGEPVYGRFSTDANGDLTIPNVPYGDYVLVESNPPEGYMIDTGMYSVRVREKGKTYQVTNTTVEELARLGNVFVNDRKLGTLKITKTAELLSNVVLEDGTTGQVADIDNIMFTITSLPNENPFNEKFVFTSLTDENGIAIFEDLPVGTYTVVEVKTNANKIYNLKDNEGQVTIEYNRQTEKTVHNITYKNKLVIVKYAPDGGDISGVVYKITGLVNEYNRTEQYVRINQDIEHYGDYGEKSTTVIDLVVGNYSVEEIINEELFVKPESQLAVLSDMTMPYSESYEAYQNGTGDYPVTTITFTNYLKIITNLRLTKKGEDPDVFAENTYTDDTAPRKPLSNVSFLIVGDPESDYEDVKNYSNVVTTDSNGQAELVRLHVGKYTVTELHPYTYKLSFTGKYQENGTTVDRVFYDYISPVTETDRNIRNRLRNDLLDQGASDVDTIAENIISMIKTMMVDENRELTSRTDSYEIYLQRIGTNGNVGYIVDTTPREIELTYMGPGYYWSMDFNNKLQTANIKVKKTSEDDHVDGTRFYVEGYATTGIHCSYYFDADTFSREYDAATGTMKNVASFTQRLLTGTYNVREVSKTQYNLSTLDSENDFDEDGNIKPEVEKQAVDITSSESMYLEPEPVEGVELDYSYHTGEGTGTASFYNRVKRGNIKIHVDAEDREKGNLGGFVVKVTGISPNGDRYSKYFTTDENGDITVNDLVVGEYTVEEQLLDENGNALIIMDPYILPNKQNVTVSYQETEEVNFMNVLERGPLEIIKTSVDGKVEGVQFKVEGYQKNKVWFEGIFTTDADGRIYEEIISGEYLVTEIFKDKTPYHSQKPITVKVDKDGYALVIGDDGSQEATPTDATPTDAPDDGEPVRIAKFHNTFAEGSIMVTLTSSDNNVAGFTFRLTGKAYNGETVNRLADTDTDGIARFPIVPVGEYKIEEIATDATIPYVLPKPQNITVIEDETVSAFFFNKLITGTVKVTLIGNDKKKLADGVFTLYDLDRRTVRGTIVTDANGTGTLPGIVYGEYYIRQTGGPSKYQVNKNFCRIVIHKDGIVCKYQFINKRYLTNKYDDIPYTGYAEMRYELPTATNAADVPATGDMSNYNVMMVFMALSALTAVFAKKKKTAITSK